MRENVAGIYLLDILYHIDIEYSYYVPEALDTRAVPGAFVSVPFGGGNRKKVGVIFSRHAEDPLKTENLKPILSVLDNTLSLNEEMRELCLYLKEHTFCTISDVVHTVTPTASMSKINAFYSVSRPLPDTEQEDTLSGTAHKIYDWIFEKEKVSAEKLFTVFPGCESELSSLIKKEYIKRDIGFFPSNKRTSSDLYILACDPQTVDTILQKSRSKYEKQILKKFLLRETGICANDLKDEIPNALQHLQKLEKKGLLLRQNFHFSETDSASPNNPIVLSPEQTQAAEQLISLLDGTPKGALLRGITGSGKTQVMKAVIDKVLDNGKQVIVLVPEIALTPQTVSTFREHYGNNIAIIHSMLSAGERLQTWKQIQNGEIRLCIGTRSAVFAPFQNLGLIIIDEEQEHTYKSDMNPKYHARDIARFRCNHHKALLLLASATPSIESYYKALNGNYHLVELNQRYGNATLPDVLLSDLRNDILSGNDSPLGYNLITEISKNIENGQQTILFINRRGYNNLISCQKCGEAIKCPHCSVPMTFHKLSSRLPQEEKERTVPKGFLSCHYCGTKFSPPKICPSCESPHIQYIGWGIQKTEEELKKHFGDQVTVIRMDADTTQAKDAYEEILTRFKQEEANILLGTQMVTKGHNFPNVTLVGVLLADSSLYLNDYRSNERTFSLLTQVIGRAGRGDKNGRAIVQTLTPSNETLLLAASQDFKKFADSELKLRKALLFPPFCDIASITFISSFENEVLKIAGLFQSKMKEWLQKDYKDVKMILFGPFEAQIYKINDKYRLKLVIKFRSNKRSRELLSRLLVDFGKKELKKVSIGIDINPTNI